VKLSPNEFKQAILNYLAEDYEINKELGIDIDLPDVSHVEFFRKDGNGRLISIAKLNEDLGVEITLQIQSYIN